jgi:flagellin-specific chaperone FliS
MQRAVFDSSISDEQLLVTISNAVDCIGKLTESLEELDQPLDKEIVEPLAQVYEHLIKSCSVEATSPKVSESLNSVAERLLQFRQKHQIKHRDDPMKLCIVFTCR